MSIHTWKSIEKAREKGAFAGEDLAVPLWNLSKRELIEIALRLGGLTAGNPDDLAAAVDAVNNEHATLRRAGII